MKNQRRSGQAIVEYMLLISMISLGFFIFMKSLSNSGLGETLITPVTGRFQRAYKNGNPEAKGFDDGGPVKHPRAEVGQGSFRIFISLGQRTYAINF